MTDDDDKISDSRLAKRGALMLLLLAGISLIAFGQVSSGDTAWTTTAQQADAGETLRANPIRTRTSHTESGGRIIDKTVLEAVGLEGRYIPYLEIERESVRVNATTVRTIERSYGRNSDGQRILNQETQEESRTLPDGEKTVTRATSNPDANGVLQVVQRAIIDSKQVGPDVRETKTTWFSADGSGGLGATVEIEERERQVNATTTEFTKSTSLSDGVGHWKLSEVREGTSRQDAGGSVTTEERVLRPDGSGEMHTAERTVREQSGSPGKQNDTTETYSINVPGQAGDEDLRLVRHESTVQQTSASGERSTTTRVEQPNPGDPGAGLQATEEAIEIARPGLNGTADVQRTILTPDSDGRLRQVWVDIGKTVNPPAVKVDTAAPDTPK